ncbi:MAG: sigma 54-interacting transcriptional regulator [Nitrospirales bacterium]
MEFPTPYEFEVDSLKELLLEIAQERSVESLMRTVVRRLAERPAVALVRIWLLKPGDLCPSCPMRKECPDQTACLHLVASAGRSVDDPSQDWSYLHGAFSRMPLGARKVGRIGSTGEQVLVKDIAEDPTWIARPDWAMREGIRCFNGQPILHKGNILGVIAVFARIPLPDEAPVWLRMIADHVAAALAHAGAFEEIERLRAQLELENTYLREEVREAQAFGDIVGQSPALRNTLRQIELVAPTDAGVLILGESGTGKELVAREIHGRSKRREKPLIRVNCASIPRELYESEFFGHVKGSFTGAVRDRAGRFQAADAGTLFLDEVGEIPLELQSKLLRVLQEGQYERVGDERTRHVNVRIIAATNRDLKKEVDAGRFRQDLFFRLNVFPIEVAPLRRRNEDIPLLAAHFMEAIAKRLNCSKVRLTQANMIALQSYDWPGNVRELQNVIERAVITAQCGTLHFDLPGAVVGSEPPPSAASTHAALAEGEVIPEAEMHRREVANVLVALNRANWKIYGAGGAAELLGVKPTTLVSRVQKMGIKRPQDGTGGGA